MNVRIFGFAVLIISWGLFASVDSDADIIYWDGIDRLSWADFEAEPRMDIENFHALTSSGIIDYKGCKEGVITYKFRAYFEKDESWVKEEAITDYHLAHEQLHFDITELYTRKLRKLLSELEFKCGQEKDFERFVAATLENWYNEQRNYDIMTRHSLNTEQQREWQYRIKMELSLLDNYAE